VSVCMTVPIMCAWEATYVFGQRIWDSRQSSKMKLFELFLEENHETNERLERERECVCVCVCACVYGCGWTGR